MSTYFSVIFKVHQMIFRYDVCLEEYMDLLLMSVSGTTSKDTKPMQRIERSRSQKKLK